MFLQTYLDGTYHILVIYIILLTIVPIIFLLKKFDALIEWLNKFEFNKTQKSFKLNYIGLVASIILIVISEIFMGFKALRHEDLFWTYAALAFIFLPFFWGFLAVYSYIIKSEGYKLGNGILIFISFSSFGWMASNVHDVIWCGVVTEFYTISHHAGDDLMFWYGLFGITDRSLFNYRSFGTYMFLSVLFEIMLGTLTFYKFYRLNKEEYQDRKFAPKICYIVAFCNAIYLGFVIAAIDFGWVYSDLQIFYFAFVQLSVGSVVFSLNGVLLRKKKVKKKKS